MRQLLCFVWFIFFSLLRFLFLCSIVFSNRRLGSFQKSSTTSYFSGGHHFKTFRLTPFDDCVFTCCLSCREIQNHQEIVFSSYAIYMDALIFCAVVLYAFDGHVCNATDTYISQNHDHVTQGISNLNQNSSSRSNMVVNLSKLNHLYVQVDWFYVLINAWETGSTDKYLFHYFAIFVRLKQLFYSPARYLLVEIETGITVITDYKQGDSWWYDRI